MRLVQFAIPERFGVACAEAVTRVAGGATLIEAMGWWVNGSGEVERERVSWLIVGVDGEVNGIVELVKEILRGGGESAIFYTIDNEAKLEWL